MFINSSGVSWPKKAYPGYEYFPPAPKAVWVVDSLTGEPMKARYDMLDFVNPPVDFGAFLDEEYEKAHPESKSSAVLMDVETPGPPALLPSSPSRQKQNEQNQCQDSENNGETCGNPVS